MPKNSNPSIPLYKRPKGDKSELIFLNDDLEQMFTQNELTKIANMWNKRISLREIIREINRDGDEISLALFHLARSNRLTRSFMSELGIVVKSKREVI